MATRTTTCMKRVVLPKEEMRSYLSEERSKKVELTKGFAGDTRYGGCGAGRVRIKMTPKYPGVKVSDPVITTQPSTGPALERLGSITSGHMTQTLDRACQPTHPTIYCVGLHVDPRSQGLGVGTRMVQWATEFADVKGAAAWAHLSDSLAGIRALEKNGFEEVNTVTVDLDEYATKGTDKPWGHYSQHCMYRPPHATSPG